jgi:hypothetical protein
VLDRSSSGFIWEIDYLDVRNPGMVEDVHCLE